MSFDPPTLEEIQQHLHSVPLFPLPKVVFIPGSLLPLHVFEPRYRDLVRDALDSHRLVAVPQLAPGWEASYEGTAPVHEVCGLGHIVRHQALDDGRYNVILFGLARIRIHAENPVDTSYRQVRALLCQNLSPGPRQLEALSREIEALGASMMSVRPELAGALARVAEGRRDPLRYIDGVAHLVLTDADTRQAYLDSDEVEARVALVQSALATALAGTASVEA